MSEGMNRIAIEPSWVLMDLRADSDLNAIEKMARNLAECRVVKESFIEAVVEREKVYATGLQCEGIGVAIPHTDTEHVLIQGMGIARLDKPVIFKQMGFPEMEVEVKLIFMLAVKQPTKQVEFLQSLMTLFEDRSKLELLMKCNSAEELTQRFKVFFETRREEEK